MLSHKLVTDFPIKDFCGSLLGKNTGSSEYFILPIWAFIFLYYIVLENSFFPGLSPDSMCHYFTQKEPLREGSSSSSTCVADNLGIQGATEATGKGRLEEVRLSGRVTLGTETMTSFSWSQVMLLSLVSSVSLSH